MQVADRIPAISDLKLKAHQDDTFPGEKTFRRFKTKDQLVSRLADFCRTDAGWQDVLAMCDGYKPTVRVYTAELPADGKQSDDTEFVYLMRSGRYFKIGKTNAAGRRERELAIQLPEKLATVHVIRTDDPAGIEDYWHRRFADKRKNGEWFDLTAADVAAFKRRKFM